MFVLQKRICVRQEWPLCSRISWDHRWIMVLLCFVLVLMCVNLCSRQKQAIDICCQQPTTYKMVGSFSMRETRDSESNKIFDQIWQMHFRRWFWTYSYSVSLQGLGSPPTAASHGMGAEFIEACLSSEWTTVILGLGTSHFFSWVTRLSGLFPPHSVLNRFLHLLCKWNSQCSGNTWLLPGSHPRLSSLHGSRHQLLKAKQSPSRVVVVSWAC